MLRPLLLLGLVSVGAAAWVVGSVASSREIVPPSVSRTQTPSRFMLMGTSSCASAACHNQDVAGIKGREYAACLQDVAHRKAYAVLSSDRSRQIVRNFYGKHLRDPNNVAPQLDKLCVQCHVHPEILTAPIDVRDGVQRFRLEDGVSCEACHGAAGGWIDRHHRPEWQNLTATDKEREYGLHDLRPIENRVRTCVGCHVGTRDVEVDHDLIAAGHPRLAFEFTGYHSLMGKHWDEHKDRDPDMGGRVDFERQAWIEGQLITLESALELLKHRMAKGRRYELSEFDCYACHHDLKVVGNAQDRTFGTRKPGQLPWNTWNTCRLDDVARRLGKKNGTSVAKIAESMQKTGQASPALFDAALGEIGDWLREARKQPPAPFSAQAELKNLKPKISFDSWDQAAQYHNAVRAVEQSRVDMQQPGTPGLGDDLLKLRSALRADPRYRLSQIQEAADRVTKAIE